MQVQQTQLLNFTKPYRDAMPQLHALTILAISLIAISASAPRNVKDVTMKSRFISVVLVGLLASAGCASFAQSTPADGTRTPMMGASGPMHHGPMGMRGHMDPAKMTALVAKRLADLKAKLKLTADQEAGWIVFTNAVKPSAAMDKKHLDRAELAKLTTPERIDKMRAVRAERQVAMNAEMDKRNDAVKIFYAILHADQKQIFDAEHARMGQRHQGEHRNRRDGHGSAANHG